MGLLNSFIDAQAAKNVPKYNWYMSYQNGSKNERKGNTLIIGHRKANILQRKLFGERPTCGPSIVCDESGVGGFFFRVKKYGLWAIVDHLAKGPTKQGASIAPFQINLLNSSLHLGLFSGTKFS